MIPSELVDDLRKLDEITLLEWLEITSVDLVDAFTDRIEDRIAEVYQKLNG